MRFTTRQNANGLWEVVIFNGKEQSPEIKTFSAKQVMKLWIWGNTKARNQKYNLQKSSAKKGIS